MVTLRSGGTLSGKVLADKQQETEGYLSLQTDSGIRVKLDRTQVSRRQRQSEAQLQYLRGAPTVKDTVEDQWRLAEWCRESRLNKERRVHLQRIVDLDPDHAKARHGLGYSFVQGQWRLQRDWQLDDGYIRYQGRWRTAQEIELMKTRSAKDSAEREWLGRVKKMRRLVGSKPREAGQQLLSIRDPHAVRALRENLAKEPSLAVRLLYVKVLGQIGTSEAYRTIIETSLNDPDNRVFYACVDQVVDGRPGFAVEAYVKGLKDPSNVRVNRSAQALADLGSPQAIPPLIDALITTHTMMSAEKSPNSSSSTMVTPANSAAEALMPSGGTSFSAGCRSRVIPIRAQNQSVLAALVKLTNGASFGFNQQAWINWHAANRVEATHIGGRRSE